MNAAVNKLKKDIWKDEAVEEDKKQASEPRRFRIHGRTRPNVPGSRRRPDKDDKTKESKTESKGKSSVKLQDLRDALITTEEDNKLRRIEIKKEKQAETKVVEKIDIAEPQGGLPELAQLPLHQHPPLEVMQQTAVSKIRRSIFKLPVSSPYTVYYPPENEEGQSEASLQKQGETTDKSGESSTIKDAGKSQGETTGKSGESSTVKDAGKSQGETTGKSGESSTVKDAAKSSSSRRGKPVENKSVHVVKTEASARSSRARPAAKPAMNGKS
ncbi:hypothetical protein EGW08_003676 [Elysia chlorotica]|uniref:Uncharacterized protein n=1 Tax=Elysia chlorotica TaxID=188477 RepID=A0A3S1HYE6_ELYCH|nr:hypothetical protein EGW08_003676 [Elysia chlorotica]